jgi:predicted O-methyltransferase YrrM
VNPARFAAELPALFDGFPESRRPHGRRFDDVAAAVPNLATENTLAVVNLAASLLEEGESYVEAGTYMGASLIAAARGNEGADVVAIDRFQFGPMTVEGRDLPAASREALEANLERFDVEATILEGDALDVLRGDALSGRRVGVFYYDAAHDYESQLEAFRLVERHLAEPALVLVDDSDWPEVHKAIEDYLADQLRARKLVEIPGSAAGRPWWWDGMAALAWDAR